MLKLTKLRRAHWRTRWKWKRWPSHDRPWTTIRLTSAKQPAITICIPRPTWHWILHTNSNRETHTGSSVLLNSMSTTSDRDIAPRWVQKSLRRLSKWIKTRKIIGGVRHDFLLNSCKYILRLGRRKLAGWRVRESNGQDWYQVRKGVSLGSHLYIRIDKK